MKTIKEIVLSDFNEKKQEGYNNYLEDVIRNGCEAGVVGRLIYFSDTCAFFDDHKEEINNMLVNIIQSTDMNIHDLFGDKFDKEDPLCLDTQNKNLLSWFAYEETVRMILEEEETV